MVYLGKEYKFRFSVAVSISIAKLCPGNDIARLQEAMKSDGTDGLYRIIAKMATEMNRAYILNERFESGLPMKEWAPIEPITEDLVFNMDNEQFKELSSEIMAAYRGGSKTTQNVEPAQKKIVEISSAQQA